MTKIFQVLLFWGYTITIIILVPGPIICYINIECMCQSTTWLVPSKMSMELQTQQWINTGSPQAFYRDSNFLSTFEMPKTVCECFKSRRLKTWWSGGRGSSLGGTLECSSRRQSKASRSLWKAVLPGPRSCAIGVKHRTIPSQWLSFWAATGSVRRNSATERGSSYIINTFRKTKVF